MPRGKRKTTPTGAPAQSVRSVPGQRYGEGVNQQQLQQQMPAVDQQAATAASLRAAGSAASQQPGLPPAGNPAPDLAAILGQAPIGLLSATQLPQQPITAGLSTGPGPGPEGMLGLGTQTPLARMLRELSRRSGDPEFAALADRAGL